MSLPNINAKTVDEIQTLRLNDKLDNPLAYLMINYQCFLNKIYSLSITEPSKYYVNMLEYVHNIIFDLLRYGQISNVSYTEGHCVGYPCEKVNQICMSFSVLFEEELDKIIALILPPDNQSLATYSLRCKHISSLIDIPAVVAP